MPVQDLENGQKSLNLFQQRCVSAKFSACKEGLLTSSRVEERASSIPGFIQTLRELKDHSSSAVVVGMAIL